MFCRNLTYDKKRISRDTAVSYLGANACLVEVCLGSVNVAIADLHGSFDSNLRFIVINKPCTETQPDARLPTKTYCNRRW